jgi:hypothetical protein
VTRTTPIEQSQLNQINTLCCGEKRMTSYAAFTRNLRQGTTYEMCCRVALEQFVNGILIEGAVKDDLDRSIAADDLHVPQLIKKRFFIL